MSKLCSVCLTVMMLAPLSVRGEAPATPPPPKWYDTFEVHGLVDTYYSAVVNQPQSEPNPLRVFDSANGFELSYAKLIAQLSPTTPYTAGFRADLGFGPTASVLGSGLVAKPPSISDVVIQQAYLRVALPADVVVDAGKFVTNTGAEVIEAKDNWIYSRSLLFGFAIPFTHTGVRVTIPVPRAEGFSIMASLFNGWDNPPKPVGSQKTGHFALMYSGPSSTSVTLNALYGRNPYESDDRLLLDGVVARSFGDLSLNVNADYGSLASAHYWGIAAMARYSFPGDKLRLTARAEYLDDTDGLQVSLFPGGNKYYEGTLSASIPVGASAELRVEGRADRVNSGTFPSGNSGQGTIQVAALAWF